MNMYTVCLYNIDQSYVFFILGKFMDTYSLFSDFTEEKNHIECLFSDHIEFFHNFTLPKMTYFNPTI